ncbi:MAG: tRNA (adenosine(37)-N6)-dimethylallyltransferase MiaA [Verrucomicrobiia bacterium]|jgi:tRNA dimethylallyltransferase
MKPLFLAGPTAVGKSAAALELARQLDAEIVSVDSMQVYRGLDIGTAKPSQVERVEIPHHLIDVIDLSESFDAAQFNTQAQIAVDAVSARGRRTIFCGGTGLYFKAWIAGLGAAPSTNADLRAELEATPLDSLLEELRDADPKTFARIDQENPRRVVRAVEVIRLTGKPFSEQRADWQDSMVTDEKIICLKRESEDLRERINRRVDQMFLDGLVEETRELLDKGLESNRTAMQAIGYRQVVEHLHGERDLPTTIDLIKTRTWQFARRQSTWFRNQMPSVWVEVGKSEPLNAICERIVAHL